MKPTERFEAQRLNKQRQGWPFDEYNEFEVTIQPQTSVIFKIKLFGPIEDTTQFNSAIEVFERASADDKVLIHLSTPGGSCDAADTFIHAMRNCEAPIHVVASGTVASAGTLILLNAPSFSLSENFVALFHNGSWGTWGKHNEAVAHSAFVAKYMEKLARTTYAGFFDEQELQALLDGKDFWMEGEEFLKRYEKRNEYLKEKFPCACEQCASKIDLAAFMALMGQDVPASEEEEAPPPAPPKTPRKRRTKAKAD